MKSTLIAGILLFAWNAAHAGAADTAPLSAEQGTVLEAVRASSLQYSKQLPDFICTQVTHRETEGLTQFGARLANARILSSDVIEEQLTYFNHKESYDVVAINLKKVKGVQHTKMPGAISTGEFGTLLQGIFAPGSHTAFTGDKSVHLRGRQADVFAFEVPKEAGIRVSHKNPDQDIVASYGGSVFVDAETKQVMRITIRIDLPHGFAIKSIKRMMDYKLVDIGGKNYNLPLHSELQMNDGDYVYDNQIDFRQYHKFAVDAKISYGGAATSTQRSVAPDSSIASTAEPAAAANQPMPTSQPAIGTPVNTTTDTIELPPAVEPTKAASTATSSAPAIMEAGKSPPPADAGAANSNFRLRVNANLVMVPVIVRDAKGNGVGDLTRDDFQLFDRGKLQQITEFMLETRPVNSPGKDSAGMSSHPGERQAATNFIVYLFDDAHLTFSNLMQVREAAGRNMDTLQPTDRAAILTTSGRDMLDFTTDRAQLHAELLKLRPHPLGGPAIHDCPDISYYMADQMINAYNLDTPGDNPPLEAAVTETLACLGLPPKVTGAVYTATTHAQQAARRVLAAGEQETRSTLLTLKHVIQMIAPAPGTKNIILISPGFIVGNDLQADAADVVDRAIRADVVISALDARGLYVLDAAGDTENIAGDAKATGMQAGFARDEASAASSVLQEISEGTGGTFVHNTNDLYAGFQRVSVAPESTYLLGFVPDKLKSDGKFHPLKVKVSNNEKLSLQVRLGYYAPKQQAMLLRRTASFHLVAPATLGRHSRFRCHQQDCALPQPPCVLGRDLLLLRFGPVPLVAAAGFVFTSSAG